MASTKKTNVNKTNKTKTQKKNTSAKSASVKSKSASAAAKKAEEERRLQEARKINQRNAILLFGGAVLLMALIIIKGENIWTFFHNILMGLFGGWAILWPVSLGYIALMMSLEKNGIKGKVFLIISIVVFVCTSVFVFSDIKFNEMYTWTQKMSYLYFNGMDNGGAALVGGIFGIPLVSCGALPAKIIVVVLLVASVMILTGTTIYQIYMHISRSAQAVRGKISDVRERNRENRRIMAENPRHIEDDYYNDLNRPDHVVYSNPPRIKEKEEKEEPKRIPEKMEPASIGTTVNAFDDLFKESFDEKPEEKVKTPTIGFSPNTLNAVPEANQTDMPTGFDGKNKGRNKANSFEPIFDPDTDIITIRNQKKDKITESFKKVDPFADDFLQQEEVREQKAEEPVFSFENPVKEKIIAEAAPVEPEVIPTVEPEPIVEETVPEPVKESSFTQEKPLNPYEKITRPQSATTVDVNTEIEDLGNAQKAAEDYIKQRENEENAELAKTADKMLYAQHKDDVATYVFPSPTMLASSQKLDTATETAELQTNGQKLVQTLESFGVKTSVVGISRGPSVTRYELQPAAGVKISKITGLADDLALNLATTGVRIEAPIPGKAAVGIEVANTNKSVVRMRELIESNEFVMAKSKLTVALGRDIAGHVKVTDLAKMPHLLIAGTTGSGKSVCINSLIISLIYKSSPDDVRFLMVDPKVVELGIYNGIPHLLVPVVTDPRKAAGALQWAVTEMLNRYKTFAEFNVRDINGYNQLAKDRNYQDDFGQPMLKMPQIVIIIDELADLMMAAPNEVEDSICRLAQMARAAGMHLVVATQRPTVDVVTGLIKANIPSRIAFAVSSAIDSRTILDTQGAEKLLGQGDMLFSPVGAQKPTRIQGVFVSDGEIEEIVSFVKTARSIEYDEKITEEIERNAIMENPKGGAQDNKNSGGSDDDNDPVLEEAIKVVLDAGQASTSLLQRKLSLGYARAGRYIDKLEQLGIIGPYEGSKPRKVLMTRSQWLERNMQKSDDLVGAEMPPQNGDSDEF